jgi:predicted dehydrogenase
MKQIALVGCAHIHTPGFIGTINRRDDVAVNLVWDHDHARAEKRQAELPGSAVTDLNGIFADPSIDAFLVCSETRLHQELVERAASTGKPLFVEKPLGMKKADGEAMAALIEANGCVFSTGYFMRGTAVIQTLKNRLEEGVFGQITRVRGSNCHSGALGGWFDGEWRWMADVEEAGVGAYGDLGTHSLDILLWLFGEVESATGIIGMGTARYPGCDETGEGLLKFKSGVIGTLAAAWDDVANPASMIVSGTKGHAIIYNGDLYLQIEGLDAKIPAPLDSPRPSGLDAWLNAVVGQANPGELVPASQAAYRSTVMEAIYQGALEQSWVNI